MDKINKAFKYKENFSENKLALGNLFVKMHIYGEKNN